MNVVDIAMDVDGVLTDGGIYLNNKGHEVVLWSSSFFHTTKKHRSKDYKRKY